MRKCFVFLLILAMILTMNAIAENGRSVSLSHGKLLAIGYTPEAARELEEKASRGENLTPFHTVDYSEYNCPADENGLLNDKILICGTVQEYFVTDNLYGIRLTQDDGNGWIVLYALKVDGEFVGGKVDGSGKSVFDDYDNAYVEFYGKYLGYSEKFKLPVMQVAGYGGMLVIDTNEFVLTQNSSLEMQRDSIYDLGYLLGSKKSIESTERYVYWEWR